MWLATQHGFFSIVHKGLFLHVRSRAHADLLSLLDTASMSSQAILVDKGTDYRFRVLLNLQELLAVMAALAQTVDYSNFKARIAALPEQRPKLEAYHELWWRLKELQERVNARRVG